MARWVWFLLAQRHFSLLSLVRLVRIRLAYARGRLAYDEFSRRAAQAYAEGIAGRSVAATQRLARQFVEADRRRLFGFVPELVTALDERGVAIMVVSGAPQVLLDEYRAVVQFDRGYGLVVEETDGVWQAAPQPSPAMRAVKQACVDDMRDGGYDILLAVGDSEADVPLLLAAAIRLRFVPGGTKRRGSGVPPGTIEVTAETIVRIVESALDELLDDGVGRGS